MGLRPMIPYAHGFHGSFSVTFLHERVREGRTDEKALKLEYRSFVLCIMQGCRDKKKNPRISSDYFVEPSLGLASFSKLHVPFVTSDLTFALQSVTLGRFAALDDNQAFETIMMLSTNRRILEFTSDPFPLILYQFSLPQDAIRSYHPYDPTAPSQHLPPSPRSSSEFHHKHFLHFYNIFLRLSRFPRHWHNGAIALEGT